MHISINLHIEFLLQNLKTLKALIELKELVKFFTQRLNYVEGGILSSSTLYFYQLTRCWPEVGPQLNVTAAVAAKSRQSCPTLCDPIDGSPPGSIVLGILQARTLEWVAIAFSNA